MLHSVQYSYSTVPYSTYTHQIACGYNASEYVVRYKNTMIFTYRIRTLFELVDLHMLMLSMDIDTRQLACGNSIIKDKRNVNV